jgi:hypothetical protein
VGVYVCVSVYVLCVCVCVCIYIYIYIYIYKIYIYICSHTRVHMIVDCGKIEVHRVGTRLADTCV